MQVASQPMNAASRPMSAASRPTVHAMTANRDEIAGVEAVVCAVRVALPREGEVAIRVVVLCVDERRSCALTDRGLGC